MNRKGLGKGQGMGYKNIVPMDSHIHSLSAKGMKTKICPCKTVKKVFNLNGYSRGNMHTIRLDPEYSIITYSEGTRNGFRHVAILMRNGYEQDKATVNYLNRTWESYDFQTVIHKLLDKAFDENKAKILKTDLDTKRGSSLMAKGKKSNWKNEIAKIRKQPFDIRDTRMVDYKDIVKKDPSGTIKTKDDDGLIWNGLLIKDYPKTKEVEVYFFPTP